VPRAAIAAELSLRGIDQVEFPPDLLEEMIADFSKRWDLPWEGRGPKLS
jgi:hypothetical protein